jgi:tetratricopeptide (TPR) repeat protein
MRFTRFVKATAFLFLALCGVPVILFGQDEPSARSAAANLKEAKAQLKKNPKSAFWHNQAAVAYEDLGDFPDAEREYLRSIQLDPQDPISYLIVSNFYRGRNNDGEATRMLRRALEIDAKNPLMHFELGEELEAQRKFDESLPEFQKAKSLALEVKGRLYLDSRRNPYEIDQVEEKANSAIERISRLKGARGNDMNSAPKKN